MDYKWALAGISVGGFCIMIAPMQTNQWPLIVTGLSLVAVGGFQFYRYCKANKK